MQRNRNISKTGLARRQRSQRFQIKDWVNRLHDMPCFILGNGPSLKENDLSLIANYFSIGINRAFYLLDPTILFWQDISLWNTEYQKLHVLQSLKVARDIADPRRLYYNFFLKGGDYKFDQSKTHILYGRGSSGPLAVQLAVSIGCRPIVLLGMDCNRGKEGESDFYGENKFWLPHTLDYCVKGLKFIKNHCPVEIFSCSNNDFWPRQSLESVLSTIDNKHAKGRKYFVQKLIA